jgi:hypothetical protein
VKSRIMRLERSGRDQSTLVGLIHRAPPTKIIYSEPIPSPQTEPRPQPDLHVLDQAIREIASEFRFTVEEVQAFYDRCGEMERTRTRFKDMRALLSERFPDDV